MPNRFSERGIKPLEVDHFLENLILTAVIQDGVLESITYSKSGHERNVHLELIKQLLTNKMQKQALLWTYSKIGQREEIIFGHDMKFGKSKIGHAALATQAIFAGEIHKIRGVSFDDGWSISNESGAWGSLDRKGGKSAMLENIATKMTMHLHIMVSAEAAFSRWSWIRAGQVVARGAARKMQ